MKNIFFKNSNYGLNSMPSYRLIRVSVCMSDKFHLMLNSKSKVSRNFLKKNEYNGHLHLLLKCHLNVTCIVVHVTTISYLSIGVWFFLHKSHYVSNSKLCMSIELPFFEATFACLVSKKIQNLCQKYTMTGLQSVTLKVQLQTP